MDKVIQFKIFLLEESAKLSKAIRETKRKLDVDIDGEASVNRDRQEVAKILSFIMTHYKNKKEKILKNEGLGYIFNNDGNLVEYKCDIKQITTPNFNTKMVSDMLRRLYRESEETSKRIDLALINSEVDYTAPFDVNAEFSEILLDFISG